MGKIIAAIVGNKFEDSEYSKPVQAFKDGGHKIVNIGLEAGSMVRGKKEGTQVTIEQSAGNANSDDFDALLIPGGKSPANLRKDENAVKFVRDFVQSDKPIFSICHGPQLLITAGVLKGRQATGYKTVKNEIEDAGATFRDEEVVTDGNLVFSRNPGDIPAFIETALNKLQ